MLKLRWHFAVLLSLSLILSAGRAAATAVEATFERLAGDMWSVEFTVRNDGSVAVIDSLSIYLPFDVATNLSIVSAPAGWDVIAIQADPALSAGAFIDLLSPGIGVGLREGESFAGLSAEFAWAGLSAPSAFSWSVNDPQAFAALESGLTTPGAPVPAIPEPSSFALMGAGIILIAAAGRRRLRSGAAVIALAACGGEDDRADNAPNLRLARSACEN